MIPENFSKALLKSARADAPLANAKARTLAHVEHALGTAAAAASAGAAGSAAASAVKATSTLKVALAAAVLVGAAGVGGGYELARSRTIAPATASMPSQTSPPSALASAFSGSPPIAAWGAPATAVDGASLDVCTALPEVPPVKCSTPKGRTVTFSLKSGCSSTAVDVMWVDESCHESFRGLLAPGATFLQDTWDTHVFRLRDHVTHRLIKELVPTQVEGAKDRDTYWKGPPTELPPVVVREGDAPIAEGSPPECMRGGGRAARLHIKNERKSGAIALMTVDMECKEGARPHLILPGTTITRSTSEGHAFRIRDENGGLLTEILPTSLDTTTYLTLP